MNDRELLELAAKAAGYTVHGWIVDRFIVNFGDGLRGEWNPLTDDCDALRLAVKCRLMVDVLGGRSFACWGVVKGQIQRGHEVSEDIGAGVDEFAATRRAIVRAAAEIGRASQDGAAGGGK